MGATKVILAAFLLIGVFFPLFTAPAAGAMALLMISAIAAHISVRDPTCPHMRYHVLC